MRVQTRFLVSIGLFVLALLSPAIPAGGNEGNDEDEAVAIGWLR